MSAANPLDYLNNFPPYPSEELASWTGANFIVQRDYWVNVEWLVVMGALFAFAMAWAIGANDVANSFATSVGSKTLTLWQACIIAGIFEFVGCMVLGGAVTSTIKGGITKPEFFAHNPEVFAFGMLCAVGTAATIVTVATYLCAAVSTTHSIIGAILGWGLVYGGNDAIIWSEAQDEFPFRKGVVMVFISWFVSPILCGVICTILFLGNRHIILRRKNSTEWAFWSLPVLGGITIWINIFFVLNKGAGKELNWDEEGKKASWVSAIVAGGCAVALIPVIFWLRRRLAAKLAKGEEEAAKDAESPNGADKSKVDGMEESVASEPRTGAKGLYDKMKKQIVYGLTVDVHEDVNKLDHVAEMHANAEVFNPETEEVYKYLQVFSAICVSFAHGANDVANAIGPFAAIWAVYTTHQAQSKGETPKWVLAFGGAGIVLGLGTYGYNIIKVLGTQMAKLTPTRGFCAELATSLTIALATIYGLPVSTTQVIVGGEVAIGLCESITGKGLNWRLLSKTIFGWVIAFVCAGLISGAFFAFCSYAPGLQELDYVNNWQSAMTNVMRTELTVLNNTAAFPAASFPTLSANISGLAKNLTAMNNFKKYGKTNMYDFMSTFKNVTWLYVNATAPQLQ